VVCFTKDLSEAGDADLWLPTKSATEALEMRNGVKEHMKTHYLRQMILVKY